MGLNLSSPILHEETVRTTFRARGACSFLLDLLRVAAVIIVPIVVSLHSGDMWKQHNIFIEMPFTNYTGRYLLKATDTAGNEYLHTSSTQVLAAFLDADARNAEPFISHQADDMDSDGKVDMYTFTIAIEPRTAAAPITRLEFLPTFDYEISAKNYVTLVHKMNAGPLVVVERAGTDAATANTPNTAHVVSGDMQWKQTFPLDAFYVSSYRDGYARTFLNDSSVRSMGDLRQIEKYGRYYAMRNESVQFEQLGYEVVDVMSAAKGSASPLTGLPDHIALMTLLGSMAGAPVVAAGSANGLFVAQIRMRVPPAVVHYVPAPSEVAKWAWIQWFAIGLPIAWLLQGFVAVIVRNAIVTTTAVYQGQVRPN